MSSVDVVVPCYNYGRFLASCINSILLQSDVDVRVLIIDDASSDDSAVIGERLAAQDPRVTFHRHTANCGHIKTFNEGVLDWARAPYTLLLSADDALAPGALARAVHVLDAHPEIGMVYGMAEIIGGDATPWNAIDPAPPTYQVLEGSRLLKFYCEGGNPVASPSAVVRTDLQQRTGGYCAKMLHTSDMEMWMRLATMSSIGVIKEIQAYYRWHGSNMTLQYTSGWIRDLRERTSTCEYVYSQWGGDRIACFGRWMSEMKKSFATQAIKAASYAIDNNDWQGYRDCIAYADKVYPYWLRVILSWRLYTKRLLGPAVWHGLRRSVTRVLRGGGQSVTNERESDWGYGKKFGWWPDAGSMPDHH